MLPNETKFLVVGAGGIGCELLKNLVLSNFLDITVIDLDTIDVSNLNRQFLFHREHVGKSKALVAKESVLKFNPNVKITAIHDSITDPKYGVDFLSGFALVLNALDNRAARAHVNRLCLAARVSLVESGSAGYLGQVSVIVRGLTECYECVPAAATRTYPACTIRNTPSEPVHCVVWAKYLFNQLFGEEDPDQDVAPDTADPELSGQAGNAAASASTSLAPDAIQVARKSTRAWARETGYDAVRLLRKLFAEDVRYLLSMSALWDRPGRRRPEPLSPLLMAEELCEELVEENGGGGLRDQQLWSAARWQRCFAASVAALRSQWVAGGECALVWDKDDASAMDFVAAAANLRCLVFGIAPQTRFQTKSIAGNIIPAIATTNAVVAGLIVLEARRLLAGRPHECRAVYLSHRPNPRGQVLVPLALPAPNPRCYVCAAANELTLWCAPHRLTLGQLAGAVLRDALAISQPDVEAILGGRAVVLVSSDAEDGTAANMDKTLAELGVTEHSRLKCEDFVQDYQVTLVVRCTADLAALVVLTGGAEFLLEGAADARVAARPAAPSGDEPSAKLARLAAEAVAVADGDEDDLIML